MKLPIEMYFSHENMAMDISSTSIGAISLFLYKQVLIGFIDHDKGVIEAVKLPITGQMYMRGIEIPYPASAGAIKQEHIDYMIKRTAYPADEVKYVPHYTLCANAQRAIMADAYHHYKAHMKQT